MQQLQHISLHQPNQSAVAPSPRQQSHTQAYVILVYLRAPPKHCSTNKRAELAACGGIDGVCSSSSVSCPTAATLNQPAASDELLPQQLVIKRGSVGRERWRQPRLPAVLIDRCLVPPPPFKLAFLPSCPCSVPPSPDKSRFSFALNADLSPDSLQLPVPPGSSPFFFLPHG